MAGRLEGKVAFITGAARGQGRSHAIRMAEEGADIVAVDICKQIDSVQYPMSTAADLAETVSEVEGRGRKILATQADVRDADAIATAMEEGASAFGGIDIVLANAGIFDFVDTTGSISREAWRDVIDVNLTGVWNTATPAAPLLRARGGGSIILTSSVLGLKGAANMQHYAASKHGVVGLMRSLAIDLAPDRIRVNSVHPGSVNTTMIQNDATYRLFRPELENPGLDDFASASADLHMLPISWLEPSDVSNAIVFLASDEARYITGATLTVDGGFTTK